MIPTAVLSLIEQILRLINNILEGTPVEQRRASAIAWHAATWPLISWMVPENVRKQVDEIMKQVTP